MEGSGHPRIVKRFFSYSRELTRSEPYAGVAIVTMKCADAVFQDWHDDLHCVNQSFKISDCVLFYQFLKLFEG